MGKNRLFGKDEPETSDPTTGRQPEAQPSDVAADQQPASTDGDPDKLAQQSELSAAQLRRGEKTTTTPDSVLAVNQDPQLVGQIDQKSPEERLEFLRGWGSRNRLGGPRSADWEEFDAHVGVDVAQDRRRP